MFLWATMLWGLVAFLIGLILAVELPVPQLNGGIEYITFGRLRPLHTNAAIFAFAGNAIFAAIYYSTQRLCKARMWSDLLGKLHFWGWQLIIVSAAVTLPLGITQGKEYAELEWPIDIAIAVVWAGFFGGNFFMTLIKRRERHMYVALWFYIATIVTVAILHIFNNLWVPLVAWGMPGNPLSVLKSYPIYAGVQDAMMQWWYGHNAVAFFLTTPFLGLMYYFLPKAAQRPVFSYRLSILHFWSLVFIYIWAGPHHLHYTALPEWASSLGMVFSLMLWMPSWGGMINGLLTLRGAWHKVTSDPILKFFVVGITFYGMATFEGPMLSIKAVNSLSHYNDWGIGHVHSGALGWNGFMVFGMVYWLAPKLFQTKAIDVKLANLHFWLATVGILLYVISMYVAGLTQGLMWRAMTPEGQLAYPDFVETTTKIIPFYWIRVGGGLLYLGGAVVGTYALYKAWKQRPEKYDEPVIEAAPLSKEFEREVKPVSTLDGVVPIAQKLDVWKTMWWHRTWERMPVKFTVLVIVAVVVASLFEIIPTFVIRSNVPTIASVTPYTPLELAGRDIYVAEGCYNCHSQMIRPILSETKRYGDYSKPGESVYDHPFQWGSRRIGPDLAREGGIRTHSWHIAHLDNPRMVPGSIMPAYPWLMKKKIDFKSIPLRMKANRAVGVPYTDEQIASAIEDAKKQAQEMHEIFLDQNVGPYVSNKGEGEPIDLSDRQAIALVAYLQRLGTDLTKPAPAPAEEEAPATEEETVSAEPAEQLSEAN
ncbi:cytochrome c oxidase cbb3-type subunit I/II [Algisphaera agarilytica]|uniref:cytochrome-c oxidase n=2 Tax=Algisphaera agarilytica TaxID=1385975 RepID=A0A7X0HB57_9BACT|nr:cytochrome c oxidase cbb3-type subunit I/II [Algisphaera agarilytica]